MTITLRPLAGLIITLIVVCGAVVLASYDPAASAVFSGASLIGVSLFLCADWLPVAPVRRVLNRVGGGGFVSNVRPLTASDSADGRTEGWSSRSARSV